MTSSPEEFTKTVELCIVDEFNRSRGDFLSTPPAPHSFCGFSTSQPYLCLVHTIAGVYNCCALVQNCYFFVWYFDRSLFFFVYLSQKGNLGHELTEFSAHLPRDSEGIPGEAREQDGGDGPLPIPREISGPGLGIQPEVVGR